MNEHVIIFAKGKHLGTVIGEAGDRVIVKSNTLTPETGVEDLGNGLMSVPMISVVDYHGVRWDLRIRHA